MTQQVQLYGVVHHAEQSTLFGSRDIHLFPHHHLLTDLQKLPRGSSVGIEWMTPGDWRRVQDDLVDRGFKKNLREPPYWDDSFASYWQALVAACTSFGHTVQYLENPELFLKYNKAVVRAQKWRERNFNYEGKNDIKTFVKQCKDSDRQYKLDIAVRQIHELDRETALLDSIKKSGVAVAIAGLGHSDFWFAHRKQIEEKWGIDFISYAAGVPLEGGDILYTSPLPGILPDPSHLADHESLERAVRFQRDFRIGSGTPDYVGAWDIRTPSHGYFEVYVQQKDGDPYVSGQLLSGTIEDCLGTASFHGKLTPNGIEFTKQYVSASSSAVKGPIHYAAWYDPEYGFVGHFHSFGIRAPFYLVEAPQIKPLELSLRWKESSDFLERLSDEALQ